MSKKRRKNKRYSKTNTGGGAHVGQSVTTGGGKFTGRDHIEINSRLLIIVSSTIPSVENPITQNINNSDAINETITDLINDAIRLHIKGKLVQALEIYRQVKDITPLVPLVDAEISAIQSEIERGRKHGYVNDRGEVIERALMHVFHFAGHAHDFVHLGGAETGKSPLISAWRPGRRLPRHFAEPPLGKAWESHLRIHRSNSKLFSKQDYIRDFYESTIRRLEDSS